MLNGSGLLAILGEPRLPKSPRGCKLVTSGEVSRLPPLIHRHVKLPHTPKCKLEGCQDGGKRSHHKAKPDHHTSYVQYDSPGVKAIVGVIAASAGTP